MYRFIYIAESRLDQEDAVNNRIINNIRAIRNSIDCDFTIIGYGDKNEMNYKDVPVKNVKRGKVNIQKIFFFIFRGFYVYKLLMKEFSKPDLIIYYGTSFRYFYFLMKYARQKNVRVICDVVEWFNPSHLPLGRFGPMAFDIKTGFKYYIPKCDGIIAISTYLQNYFISKNLKTLRIPVLIDTHIEDSKLYEVRSKQTSFDDSCLNLVYAGFPGKKDLIFNIIGAVQQMYEHGFPIRLHVIGPTTDELGINLSEGIKCYGRIEQRLVLEYLKEADFSVLLRPPEQYAHAGFPTKFVESLAAGLPVIANLTSDLNKYLRDRFNGLIVRDCSISSLIDVLNYAINIDKCQIRMMHKNAYETAVHNFDFRLFSKDFSTFIRAIIDKD